MKKIFQAAITALFIFGCNQVGTSDIAQQQTVVFPGMHPPLTGANNFMSFSDAEKILGERALATESKSETKSDIVIWRCTYTADTVDAKTGNTGVVYFILEEYAEIVSAQKNYSSIKTANENHGIKVLNNLGDEAYFHTDNENFYFILVRKGKKMFRVKVNKITSHTSLDEFNAFASRLTEKL